MKLYLINGWAMSPTTLHPLASQLQTLGSAQIISYQDYIQPTLAASLKYLQTQIPPQSVVLGWSLGGMLAMQLNHLQPAQAIICLGSNIRFVANQHWPYAMPLQHFKGFYHQQEQRPYLNLLHFLRLCYAGEPQLKTQAQTWLDTSLSPAQLLWGLNLLARLDSHPTLNTNTPQLHLFGKQDALVPTAAFNALQKNWPAITSYSLKGSHAFAISQVSQLMPYIHSFLHSLSHEPLI